VLCVFVCVCVCVCVSVCVCVCVCVCVTCTPLGMNCPARISSSSACLEIIGTDGYTLRVSLMVLERYLNFSMLSRVGTPSAPNMEYISSNTFCSTSGL